MYGFQKTCFNLKLRASQSQRIYSNTTYFYAKLELHCDTIRVIFFVADRVIALSIST